MTRAQMIKKLRARGFNYAANVLPNHPDALYPCTLLSESFIWSDTKQGEDFWRYIDEKLNPHRDRGYVRSI